ncbi:MULTISPECIES: hypothetical protein [unclassified Salipiger]|uniref:hypothetical protein n=1 Tax=unclassified Salipiger TaxID=2640570 RepID=UPI0013BA7D81|nr:MULTISPECIES: hypothetical protein [unclassified Salipiger]NDV52337.1 hypothetical protein [Salipiger sp. PrR003]NDW30928.1 hypothetical protein [Salipiger sp. PrR007]
MEGIAAIIVQAIAGMVGGGVAGQLVKTVGMAVLPKLLSGAIGGILGGSAIGAILGGGDPTAAADAATAAGGLDIGALISQLLGGAAGGGVLTAIVGQFLGKK